MHLDLNLYKHWRSKTPNRIQSFHGGCRLNWIHCVRDARIYHLRPWYAMFVFYLIMNFEFLSGRQNEKKQNVWHDAFIVPNLLHSDWRHHDLIVYSVYDLRNIPYYTKSGSYKWFDYKGYIRSSTITDFTFSFSVPLYSFVNRVSSLWYSSFKQKL